MRRQTDFVWQDARSSHSLLRWIVFCAAVALAVAYLRVGKIDDPVIAIAPPQAIELPTKKPAQEPIPLERVHILNPTPERRELSEPLKSPPEHEPTASTYNDLRRELLTGE
jgi:hypothetical protein